MEAVSVRIKQAIGEYKISSDIIGVGSYAVVRRAVHARTSQQVAVKIIDLNQPQVRERAFREAEVLREVGKHKNIIALYDFNEEDRFLYLFMEYASGGDLFSYVKSMGCLSEGKARYFFKQCVDALVFCHERRVAHHDIKLENMLLSLDLSLRLSDFGLSQRLHPVEGVTSYCGSPLYMAPEVFSLQPHNEQVDVWSLGVSLYVMVSGSFPFVANTYPDLEEKVLFDDVPFLYGLSEQLNDLIQGMLRKDPLKRMTLAAVKHHKWVVDNFSRYG